MVKTNKDVILKNKTKSDFLLLKNTFKKNFLKKK